jgi:hypothetical protein
MGGKQVIFGALILAGNLAVPAVAEDFAMPSGLSVTLHEVIAEEGLTRFRFIAPAIADLEYADVSADIATLCETVAIPSLDEGVEQVVISLSAEIVPFGETAPEITQFFDPFVIEDGRCMWEPF